MEKQTLIEFGKHIRDMRKKANLSQEDLALSAGLDRSYIGGIERGERNVSLLNLKKLAIALGITMSELLNYELDSEGKC